MGKDICFFERKEVKYLLSRSQWEGILSAAGGKLKRDDYFRYSLGNIYMDTPDFRLIRKSLEKPVYKEKMRLRSYGRFAGDEEIFIELKKKYRGIVYKRRIKIPMAEAIPFLEGKREVPGQIAREIRYFTEFYEGLAPSLFISYDREAYGGTEDRDLRLTVDSNIRWKDAVPGAQSLTGGNSLLAENQLLMEIKCARALPLWLTGALAREDIYKTSFSKYGTAYSRRCSREMIKAAC